MKKDLKRELCNYLIKNNMVKEYDVIKHSYTNARFNDWKTRNIECNNISPTLDTRCDCLGVVIKEEVDMEKDINVIGNYSPSGHNASRVVDSNGIAPTVTENHGTVTATNVYSDSEKQLFTEDGNIKRYIGSDIVDQFNEGQMATTSFPNGYGHGPRTHNESISLNTIDKPSVKNNLRIRKLTPKECFRLMGVKDEDSKNLEHLSNATQYHLAGDSIVVNVLQAIFKSILIDHPIVDQKPIRLIELFGGYGSQALALKYLGVDFEHWKLCEWAIHSIDAYKSIHFPNDNTNYSELWDKEDLIEFLYNKGISSNWNEPMKETSIKRKSEQDLRNIVNNCKATHNLINIQQVHAKDLEIKERELYNYVVTYSFPCQDLSLAGKGAGMEKGSGTRSGMLWEVERILEECEENLPQILLMENVPQVAGKKNKEHFDKWIEFLESKGYTNKWCMLNAKEVGYPEPIPQNRNRCFMVSVLDPKQDIVFPEKVERKLVLKDLLESDVDEKYYLSDNQIKSIREWKAYRKPIDDASYLDSDTSPTVTAKSNTSMNSSMLLLKDEYHGMFQYDKSDQFMKGKDRLTENKKIADCLVTYPKEGVVLIKNATKQGYLEAEEGDGIDISSRMEYHRGTVQKESTQTITTKGGNDIGVIIKENKWEDLD
jgi:DNA (cytosine-5)-methyltransferase 1